MPRLVYLDSALRDLAEIGEGVEDRSGDRRVALRVVEGLTRHCERVAALPGLLGRPRDELLQGCRSFVSGSYLVFFR